MTVFAYGSNLCVERIGARVESARARTVGRLDGHALRFHKRGRDGSAKADALETGDAADRVWGVVYEISRDDKVVLDRIEGVGHGYSDGSVRILTPSAELVTANIYRAESEYVDPALLPFTWYRDLVVRGAAQHGLPPEYRAVIEAVPTVADPDRERHARESAVLPVSGARP